MKKLPLLKKLLDLFWFFSVGAILALLLFVGYVLVHHGAVNVPIKIDGQNISIADWSSKIILVFAVLSYIAFVLGIYRLRKLLNLFSRKLIFEETNIFLLNQIGKSFLLSALLIAAPLCFYNLFVTQNMVIEFGGGFGSFLFAASLGVFFMVLSEVFETARGMKSENALTI